MEKGQSNSTDYLVYGGISLGSVGIWELGKWGYRKLFKKEEAAPAPAATTDDLKKMIAEAVAEALKAKAA